MDSKKRDRSKIVNRKMVSSNKIAGNLWTARPTGRVARVTAALLVLLTLSVELFAQTLPTLSTESSRTYYHINVAKNDAGSSYQSSYNISPTATVSVKNSTTDEEIWYFIDTWDNVPSNITNTHLSDYCYIVNAKSGEYLYYTGTTSIGNQSNIIEMKARDASDAVEDRFKFGVVQSPNTTSTTYVIYPKILGENNTSSLTNYGHLIWLRGSNSSNANLSINKGNDWNSQLTFISATDPTCSTPTITNTNGTISISSATANAKIYYTTDGTTPSNSNGTLYTTPFSLGYNTSIIKAIAYKSTDDYVSVVYTLNIPRCETPEITNTAGSVAITCSTTNATIYYTTDGSEPVIGSSSIYSSEFTPSSTATIKAIAVKEGYYKSHISARKLDVTLSGSGTAVSPYLISSDDDFTNFILYFASNPSDAGKVYKITTDIDASGLTNHTVSFSGTLTAQAKADGTFPVISGLTQPLFSTVTNATISNITFKGITVNGSGPIGAICGTASGSTRIYNCGIMPSSPTFANESSTVRSSNGYCGSIVGQLSGNARVINCYSYATITGGTTVAGIAGYIGSTEITQDNVTTVPMVVNCMFYGEISGGTTKYPVYGGAMIKNETDKGVNPYNYFRKNATFDNSYNSIDNYNRSWPAEEKNLTRFEYYRSILNSNKKLCTYWVTDKVYGSQNAPTDADEALIAKWVLDPSMAPYPILKKWGKYPSVINIDPEYRIKPTTKEKEARSTANEWEGKSYGLLTVSINAGSNHSGSGSNTASKSITITDMDTLNNDFCYYKIQLPYYNEVFGNPQGDTWANKYAGNYTDKVVTGWEITAIAGGTAGTFDGSSNHAWKDGFNFADRNCTSKDLYATSGRIFAQGGYYYVPEGVTGITITAHWGKAVYLANRGLNIDRVKLTIAKSYKQDKEFKPAGTIASTFQGQTVYNDLQNAIKALDVYSTNNATDNPNKHVSDQAIVLIGNHQVQNGSNKIGYGLESKWHPHTIMSADFDFDNEPDYCLQLQFRNGYDRPGIQPIRFDFLPVVELGLAVRHNNMAYAIGVFVPQGHFEMTETSFMHTTQFEFDGPKDDNNRVYGKSPMIINGGEYESFNVRYANAARTSYFLLGGNAWIHRFAPGAHPNTNNKPTNDLCVVNAIGGEYPEFYLSGIFRPELGTTDTQAPPHCYTNGGKFGIMAGAGYDKVKNGVTFKINHSLIGEFYGGGINGSNPVGGNIDVTIDNSRVTKYCGGPKVGDMTGKTVTTNATNTTFGVYYGGGNGGNSYYRQLQRDGNFGTTHIGTWTDENYNWNGFSPLGVKDNGTDNKGYHAEYEFEVFNESNGVTDEITQRGYINWVQFGITITGNVTNNLSGCTIEGNFYGGGNLATVNGTVTSTLTNNTTVKGNAFGAGFSASIPKFSVHDKGTASFPSIDYAGTITDGSIDYKKEAAVVIEYEWTNDKNGKTDAQLNSDPTYKKDGKWYCYTWNSLENLGAVLNAVSLTITDSYIGTVENINTGNVYGGGDASAVNNTNNPSIASTTVTLSGATTVLGSVFGGGNEGLVSGSTTVNIVNEINE